jgi:hypothetical protein
VPVEHRRFDRDLLDIEGLMLLRRSDLNLSGRSNEKLLAQRGLFDNATSAGAGVRALVAFRSAVVMSDACGSKRGDCTQCNRDKRQPSQTSASHSDSKLSLVSIGYF